MKYMNNAPYGTKKGIQDKNISTFLGYSRGLL